jgi:hypothetical protein
MARTSLILPNQEPGPATKVICSFSYIHLKDDELAVCCKSQYQSTSGHNIANVIHLDQCR